MNLLFKILIVIIVLLGTLPAAYGSVSIYVSTLDTNAHFMLVDYNGKRTGYDPALQDFVSETGLPIMMYYVWNPYNPAIPGSAGTPQYHLQGQFPIDMINLKLKLIITGMNLSMIKRISMEIRENSSRIYPNNSVSTIITPIIDVGQVLTYDITYVPTQSLVFTKVAAPNDLITDINTAFKLNLIGNQEYVTELINKVNKIEQLRTQPAIVVTEDNEHDDDTNLTPAQKIKKSYQKLLKEITEKYNKPEVNEFVKQEAYDTLKADLEYIIGHIQ